MAVQVYAFHTGTRELLEVKLDSANGKAGTLIWRVIRKLSKYIILTIAFKAVTRDVTPALLGYTLEPRELSETVANAVPYWYRRGMSHLDKPIILIHDEGMRLTLIQIRALYPECERMPKHIAMDFIRDKL